MRNMFVLYINERKSQLQIQIANTFWLRLKGLMVAKELNPGKGLLLIPCKQVHTFFMKFSIDVLFLDGRGRVLRIIQGLGPSQISLLVRDSFQVLELAEGTVQNLNIKVGDIIQIKDS